MAMLDYPFLKTALVMGVVLGVLFSLIGIFVVTRGMAFFSDFIAHSAILGSALAVLLDIEPTLFLIPYSVVVGLAVSSVWHSSALSRDTVLGAFYGGTVAAGVLLIAWQGLSQTYLMRFLFGDMLLVGPLDVWLSVGLLLVFVIFLKFNLKGLLRSSLLPEISRAEGLRVKAYDLALVGLVALTVALSIKVVGVLLANAMVVIPAAAAKTLSRNFAQFLVISPIVGVLSFVSGTAASFYLNLPSGPSVAAAAFCLFCLSLAVKRARGN